MTDPNRSLDRIFRVSVVGPFRLPLLGARLKIFRNGLPKGDGVYHGTPYLFQISGPGDVECEASYKEITKRVRLVDGETDTQIKLAVPWSTLQKVAVAAIATIALLCVWLVFANRGFISPSIPTVKASYIGPEPHDKKVAIVFVHGIFGDGSTWGDQETSFPSLLYSDPTLAGKIDVFTFQYYSPRFGPASNVSQLAKQLRATLESDGIFEKHSKVAFLVHSMGGLITRRCLILMPDVRKVAMIYFYSTPTDGAVIASNASRISSSPQLRSMIPLERNEALSQIQDDWLNRSELQSIPSYCAYETIPTDGVLVVTESSARALCNRLPIGLAANHLQIVKPESRSDLKYTLFRSALEATAFTKTDEQSDGPKKSDIAPTTIITGSSSSKGNCSAAVSGVNNNNTSDCSSKVGAVPVKK